MPQSFKNSPAVFQIVMDYVLKSLLNTSCVVYIDDILVFGKNELEHAKNLKKVLERLDQYNLKEKYEKRKQLVTNMLFLGHEISYNSIKPALSRSQGIKDYKVSKTRKELQRFLGMLNYERVFERDISSQLSPLYKLLQKDKKFLWTNKETKNLRI